MKLISFFYPSTEVKHSTNLVLFFRLVGIYVVEIQTDLISMCEDSYEDKVISSDAVLYLVTDKNTNYVFDHRVYKDKFIGLEREKLDQYEVYKNILFILNSFIEKKIIDNEEFEDLKEVLNIYANSVNSYIGVTLLGKYYFKHSKEKYVQAIQQQYRDLGGSIADILNKHSISMWGNEGYLHCRYAFINVLFELNIFCKKNDLDYYVDSKSLLNACKHIDVENEERLGNSFKVLQAQIYDQLLENMGEAFKIYVACCNNSYDSYVYFCKGDMMYKKREVQRAIDYYKQSTRIYPQYYRAWYKLAVCYKEVDIQENWKLALVAFEKVVQILHNKANNNLLRALEIEYLFDSYMNILDIKKRIGDFRGALAYCDEALKIYLNLDQDFFYEIMGIRLIENESIKMDITSHLDMEKLKKEGIELSMMFDLTTNAIRYVNLVE